MQQCWHCSTLHLCQEEPIAVQVNDIVTVLCKLLDCCCPIDYSLVVTIIYFNSNNLVRNDEIPHNVGAYLYYIFTDTLDQVSLTSSISGRNACPSEEVTFTCTAQGPAVFWTSAAFGEKAIHHTSVPSTGDFTAKLVCYNRTQNCLVSSLNFHATASRNGTTVTCTTRNRTSNQSLSLHITSSESAGHILDVDES